MLKKYSNYFSLSEEEKELIYYLITFKRRSIEKNLIKKNKELFKKVKNYYSSEKMLESLFCFINNIKQNPRCTYYKCNNFVKFDYSRNKGFKKYCSSVCSNKCSIMIKKRENTILKKYGVRNISQNDEIKKKKIETTFKNYGVKNPFELEEIRIKSKKTNLLKYGSEYPTQSKIVRDKTIKTNFKKFGKKSPAENKKIKNKMKKYFNEKFGVDNPFQHEDVKNKSKKTNLLKYGVEYASQNNEIKNRIKITNLLKYGVTTFLALPINKENLKKSNILKWSVEFNKQKHITNYDKYNDKSFIEKTFIFNEILNFNKYIKFFNISYKTGNRQLKLLNIKFKRKKYNQSLVQSFLFDYIYSFFSNSKLNNKIYYNYKFNKKLELDIYIPNKKIAIEYNGLMFHSFGKSKYSMFNNYKNESLHKKKHLIKTELCEEQNIQLLHINEDEWLNPIKQKIWKSMIKSKLGLLDKKIFARKTLIKEISYKEAKGFLINNHIQGESISKINLGLFPKNDSNKLIGVMTFGKPRYSKSADWELIRFCSQLDLNIVGGGSKLLNYFTSKYMQNGEQLISYGNRRWTYSKKNFYIINGFEFIENSNINYYYFHEKNLTRLYHRSVFQKHKIERYYNNRDKLIFNFDKSLTERINMYNNGYRKIFDCGQLVYRYIKQ